MMKKFLPVEDITYRTALDAKEIIKRISENVGKKATGKDAFFGKKSGKLYEGTVSGAGFEISRAIDYRNSFLPVIKGRIEPGVVGTNIYVTMRLDPLVMVFISVWLGIAVLTSIMVLYASVRDSSFFSARIVPFSMLLFGYGLTIGSFKYESSRSKEELAELFEASTDQR